MEEKQLNFVSTLQLNFRKHFNLALQELLFCNADNIETLSDTTLQK
jgi:hypothetical protein